MYLFLEGKPRLGKSTAIRNALLPYVSAVSGFMVQRLFVNGEICGYRACTVNGSLPELEAPYTEGSNGVFLYQRKSYPAVLDTAIIRAQELCERDTCKLVLLDEIGGLELSSPAFTKSLEKILALGKPCLGVVKSRGNLIHMTRRVEMGDDILGKSAALHAQLAAGGNVLHVQEDNLSETQQAVKAFLLKHFKA